MRRLYYLISVASVLLVTSLIMDANFQFSQSHRAAILLGIGWVAYRTHRLIGRMTAPPVIPLLPSELPPPHRDQS